MPLVSLWQDRHDRDSQPAPGALPDHSDVVVVGAGLTGLTTALLLARAGREVTVLEGRWVGAGTTGGSTAKVSLLQGTRLSMISKRHPLDTVRAYVEANTEAQAWVRRFCDDHGVAVQTRPAATYGNGQRGRRAAEQELEACRRAGLAAEWDEQPPLPFQTTGSVRMEGQLQLDPVALLEALLEQALAHGVRLVEGVRVRSAHGRRPVRVETEHGDVTANHVVLATGTPILDRGGFFARLHPMRSYIVAFRTPEQAVDGMYLAADSPSRSLRDAPADDGGHLLLVGGEGHVVGRDPHTARRLDALRSWTAEHYPGAVETHAWSAQDYEPAHELPFAGPVLPNRPDILVASGFAKWGMTNGVAAALALTAQLTGGQMPWSQFMLPWQRREVRGALKAAQINAEVGFQMTSGWLRPVAGAATGRSRDGEQGVVEARRGTPTATATVDGEERSVSGVCSHLGGVVRYNEAERSWDCPLHGSRFGTDGGVLEGPATCGLRRR